MIAHLEIAIFNPQNHSICVPQLFYRSNQLNKRAVNGIKLYLIKWDQLFYPGIQNTVSKFE